MYEVPYLIIHFTGLDLGQVVNGYIYHTKYDRVDVIPQGALQNTGDNVLGLVRSLANATELYNMQVECTIYLLVSVIMQIYIFIRPMKEDTAFSSTIWDCFWLRIRRRLAI